MPMLERRMRVIRSSAPSSVSSRQRAVNSAWAQRVRRFGGLTQQAAEGVQTADHPPLICSRRHRPPDGPAAPDRCYYDQAAERLGGNRACLALARKLAPA
jgi:hypothetical protein